MRYTNLCRFFAALALLGLPVAGYGQNGTGIYMGQGLVLRAAPPHQLTLNAHVSEFAYLPGGDDIAYISTRDDDDARTVSIKFVGTHQKDPDTRTLYNVTGAAPGPQVPESQVSTLDLLGWSADGRYLIFQQGTTANLQEQYFCIDSGSSTFLVRPIPMPETAKPGITLSAWSPSHRRFLITADEMQTVSPFIVTAAEVYNPARGRVQPLAIPDGLSIWGWLDENHLLLFRTIHFQGAKSSFLSHDLASGAETEIARPTPWPSDHGVLALSGPPHTDDFTPKAPGLTLEAQLQILKDAQGVAEVSAYAVWIRKAKAPKAMSALPVGVTPSTEDPQAQWSSEGDGVAFIAHEDLFVAALTEQEATPHEKVAAGETLDCEEERRIVEENLKQLGLGILQYTEDNDEKLPSANGWHDAVYPYIKDENVFNFAGIRPVYHAPPNLSLAAMDAPAEYVLATADTPCAHIVLYGDGHVKSFDHSGNGLPTSDETH